MIKTRLLTATAMAAAAATVLPQAASAQRIDRVVAFGDSYADDGNAFELGGVDPRGTVVYTSGRFSNGPAYTEVLANLLGASDEIFAVGGAKANGGNTNDFLPGLDYQIASFLSGGYIGVGPDVFPSVSGTLGEGDLVTFNIGGNDARDFQLDVATGAADIADLQAEALNSAAGATAALDAVVGAGARTISWINGNTANLPETALYPPAAQAGQIRQAYNDVYDAATRPVLANYAAQGIMVHYLDLDTVAGVIEANLAEFGFTGTTCPIFDTAAAAGGDLSSLVCALDNSVANQFVFYGDGVHLTAAGSAVIARYVATQLQAPLTLDAPSDVALENAHQMGRIVGNRIAGTAPRDGDYAEGFKLFVQGDGWTRTKAMNATTDELAMNGAGVTAGFEYGFGNGMLGLAGRYAMPEGEFFRGSAAVEATSLTGAVYGAYALGPLFAQAYAGLGRDDFDLTRAGVLESLPMTAEFDGDHFIAGGKIGYLANMLGARIGPVIALDHVSLDVDGYDESGDPALMLSVAEVSLSSLRGQAGLEMRGDFEGYGIQIRPYAALVAEQELDADQRTYRFAQATSPDIVNRWTTAEIDDGMYGRFTSGFTAMLAPGVDLNAAMSFALWKDSGNDASVMVGLGVGL
ncbi:autotransporter domain-containing protein [Sphingomicrobium astaxanthinifaciens]|uniref:autotransporter domain-containing protein n=1 Tax=Sphingomicrobium astaxanthinifaciens TaxID=1227949 RepID=UPI001FCBF8A3|nr:autotransporter domain-containing protein [Sphingomicrobium astaxanthinifaciens]MCJ7421484.1 autotransporter domain-containing protein [Sphingomicrobium astaxanthinifaciens]